MIDRITILTPCADGHEEPWESCQSRAMQTIPNDRIFISREKNHDNPRLSENQCRNVLRKYATGEYVIMMDSDVVFTSPTDIADAIAWIDAHQEYEAGAYNTKGNATMDQRYAHVCVACMIVRSQVLTTRHWRYMAGNCSCIPFAIDNKISYIDDRCLVEVRRRDHI